MPSIPSLPDALAERVQIKRIYRAVRVSDGKRILIDRLWPRGVSKERARLSAWMKDIAPSPALRRSWHRGEIDWPAFKSGYERELSQKDDLLRELAGFAQDGFVTLIYAARNDAENHAIVLRDVLRAWINDKADPQA